MVVSNGYKARFQIHLLPALLSMILAGLLLYLNLVPREASMSSRFKRAGIVRMNYGWPDVAEIQYRHQTVTDAIVKISPDGREASYRYPHGESGVSSTSAGDGWIFDSLLAIALLTAFTILCEYIYRRRGSEHESAA
jgi:hypothetical protein